MKNRTYCSLFDHSIKIRVIFFYFIEKNIQTNIKFYRILDHKAEDTSKGLTIGIVLSVMFLLAAVLIIVIIKLRRKRFGEFFFAVMFSRNSILITRVYLLLFDISIY